MFNFSSDTTLNGVLLENTSLPGILPTWIYFQLKLGHWKRESMKQMGRDLPQSHYAVQI